MAGVVYERKISGTGERIAEDEALRSKVIARFASLLQKAFASPGGEHDELDLHLSVSDGAVSLHDHPSPVLKDMREHSQHHPDVINRAKYAADQPYDQRTCRIYPWAAAARITFLEAELKRMEERSKAVFVTCGGITEEMEKEWRNPGHITYVPFLSRRKEITRSEFERYCRLREDIESDEARCSRNKMDMGKKIFDPKVRSIMLAQLDKEVAARTDKLKAEIVEMGMPLPVDDPPIVTTRTQFGGAGEMGKVSINVALGLKSPIGD